MTASMKNIIINLEVIYRIFGDKPPPKINADSLSTRIRAMIFCRHILIHAGGHNVIVLDFTVSYVADNLYLGSSFNH